MKRIGLLCLLALFASRVIAQDIEGTWGGTLTIPQGKLRLVFNLKSNGNGYTATMDSPDQNAAGIKVDSVSFVPPTLYLELKRLGAAYKGTYDASSNTFKGEFTQMGFKLSLDLSRALPTKPMLNRPQEPKEPYPYKQEEVTFRNMKDSVTLAGTLTLPEGNGPFPAVVLVTGSGPQNRNEELMGHKPFLVVADYLTRQGIAVLRYDDRGVGKSTGKFTTATTNDFANDAAAVVAFLQAQQGINPKKVGIVGHSEGGLIAYMEAARDPKVAFIVSLAGPSLPGDEILIEQNALISKADGVPQSAIDKSTTANRAIYDIIIKEKDEAKIREQITAIMAYNIPEGTPADQRELLQKQGVAQITSPWFLNFIRYNPATDIAKIKVPVLFMVGENDYQVPAKTNIAALELLIATNKMRNISIKPIAGANHLFQKCRSCTVAEYAQLEETFTPEALAAMTSWIKQVVKQK